MWLQKVTTSKVIKWGIDVYCSFPFLKPVRILFDQTSYMLNRFLMPHYLSFLAVTQAFFFLYSKINIRWTRLIIPCKGKCASRLEWNLCSFSPLDKKKTSIAEVSADQLGYGKQPWRNRAEFLTKEGTLPFGNFGV